MHPVKRDTPRKWVSSEIHVNGNRNFDLNLLLQMVHINSEKYRWIHVTQSLPCSLVLLL